jgi:hypothetical protein
MARKNREKAVLARVKLGRIDKRRPREAGSESAVSDRFFVVGPGTIVAEFRCSLDCGCVFTMHFRQKCDTQSTEEKCDEASDFRIV